jgi:glycosyltransferase involved in cell wall biosynthesis
MILEVLPDATLTIAYGVEHIIGGMRWSHNREGEMATKIMDVLEMPGVNYVGKIGQKELSEIQMRAHALLYPCDPMSPTETGCITVIEALAAGAVAVITDADCLGGEFSQVSAMTPLPLDPADFADLAVKSVQDESFRGDLVQKGFDFASERDWKGIADSWINFFEDRSN